jgi:SAM-dependent methyltransferase
MLAEYHQLGWRVSGMEPDPDFFQSAFALISEIPDSAIYRGGFEDMNFDNEVDLITAINNPFSYLLDVAARLDALERIYRALKPGGVFFLELTNFLYKLQHFEPIKIQSKAMNGETVLHIMENHVDLHHARWLMRDQYIIEGKGDIVVKQHEQAVMTLPELLYFLEQQGFTSICTYSGYQARTSGPVVGKTILISAQKPAQHN